MSKIKLKNNIDTEFSIEHIDDTQAISVSSVDMSKVKPIDTISDLIALQHTPSTVWVSGYTNKGDGAFGSHIFEWDSSSTEDDNGGTIIKLDSITTGRYKLRYDGSVNVKWFGAKDLSIDDTYDSYSELTNAISFITNNGGDLLLDGYFGVSQPLLLSLGFYCTIRGATNAIYSSGIKALTSMDYVLKLGQDIDNFEGDYNLNNFTIDGNNISGCINAETVRYSVFKELRLVNYLTEGIVVGAWVNRITTNVLNSSQGVGIKITRPSGFSTSVNNLVIENNSISSSEFGVYSADDVALRDLLINGNSFDSLTKSALYFYGDCEGLRITQNYIEACGGENTVETSSGVFTTVYGAMIFGKNYNNVSGWKCLEITSNHFSNCLPSEISTNKNLISAENIISANINFNSYGEDDEYNSLVSLFGTGIVYTIGEEIIIKSSNKTNSFVDIVENLAPQDSFCKMRIKETTPLLVGFDETPNLFKDFTSWTAGDASITKSYYLGMERTNFVSNGQYRQLDIPLEYIDAFKGKYFKIDGIMSAVDPETNGLRIKGYIDTGSGFVLTYDANYSSSGTVPVEEKSKIFKVPKETIAMRLTLDTVVDGEVNIDNLRFTESV